MGYGYGWRKYVPVSRRRANAVREAKSLAKRGRKLRPIEITTSEIATSFWGKAWCENLAAYADWSNRLPRGMSYARNGSIIDLQIASGEISALVSGSSVYEIKISIDKIGVKKWAQIRKDCSAQVSSLLDLMRGKLPDSVLKRLTAPQTGMFPGPRELRFSCSCPDDVTVCKHVAATLYGVGYLLDSEPELFFKMRGVDQSELVSDVLKKQSNADVIGLDQKSELADEDLSAIFGVDFAIPEQQLAQASSRRTSVAGKSRTAKSHSGKTSTAKRTTAKHSSAEANESKEKLPRQKSKAVKKPTKVTDLSAAVTRTKAVKKPSGKVATKVPATGRGTTTAVKETAARKTAVKKSSVNKATVKKAIRNKAAVS